mmetsp:Transcript_95118/g.273874  ORF Transcript_95118/g.273874 Transcript_95118/m.273874 type:complete len:237 (-) Transcript_95118:123-833(-)
MAPPVNGQLAGRANVGPGRGLRAIASTGRVARTMRLRAPLAAIAIAVCGPAMPEAKDLFQQLSQFKPPAKLLEDGAIIGRTVEETARGSALQKAVAEVVPGGDIAQIPKHAGDVKKVHDALNDATSKLAQALQNTDPDRIAETLRLASDPEGIKDIIDAIGEFEYWKQHWRRAAAVCLATIVCCVWASHSFCRLRRHRKHSCIVLEESDRALLELEDGGAKAGFFSRSEAPSMLCP